MVLITVVKQCCRSRRHICHGACLQGILLSVLIITLIFNIMFIMDNRGKLGRNVKENVGKQDENKHIKIDDDKNNVPEQNLIAPNPNGMSYSFTRVVF